MNLGGGRETAPPPLPEVPLKIRLFLVAVAAASLLSAQALSAGAKGKAPTEKGTYKEWNDDLIDRLEVVQNFSLASYSRLVLLPLDTVATPLPEKEDNTYAPTTQVLGKIGDIVLEGMRKGLSGKLEASAAPSPPEGEATRGTLVLRGKVREMNPGSRAARYWVGFGAGKSRVELECEVVDAATGEVLLRLTHARASGIGAAGGDYAKFLTDDAREAGEDIGKMLLAF